MGIRGHGTIRSRIHKNTPLGDIGFMGTWGLEDMVGGRV